MSNPQTDPAAVKVFVKTGEGVRIDWKDGHHSEYSFDYLRTQCPCAACQGHGPKQGIISDLPMYREKARATHAEPVGHYALRFTFSDGHSTGIYSFEHLRAICPCPHCRQTRYQEAGRKKEPGSQDGSSHKPDRKG